MKTTLARAAVVAATRIVQDLATRPNAQIDRLAEVKEAHISLFDAAADDATPKARRHLQQAADLANDLVTFAQTVKGGRA